MELELKLDFSSIYVYTYIPIEFRKDVFHQIKIIIPNYHIAYLNQHYISSIIDGGELKVRCDLVLFTPVNLRSYVPL